MKPARLLIATHNAGKLEEFRELLTPLGIEVVGAGELNLEEPEETGSTFIENARIKARAACEATGLVALADDSGLEVDALDGAPGVYTADWAETPSGRDFAMAMAKVHREILASGAPEPWAGRFRCTLLLARPDGSEEIFDGRAEGRLVWPIRGAQGHGFDPMFEPTEGGGLTFAEMSASAKNAISHRGKALALFLASL